FLTSYRTHRDHHSIPTRRSSDLGRHRVRAGRRHGPDPGPGRDPDRAGRPGAGPGDLRRRADVAGLQPGRRIARVERTAVSLSVRSEEHTSELQSREILVLRLLLE